MPATDTLSGRARAYCGPAHGHSWELDGADSPPLRVDLGVGDHRASYRLVWHPVTRRPARDHWGNYLYMPLRHSPR